MKLAIIGSRSLKDIDLQNYIDFQVDEIVSGGALGIDKQAEKYAQENNIPTKVFMPDYRRYRKGAPLIRNIQIIEYADKIIAFWDGKSKGTA